MRTQAKAKVKTSTKLCEVDAHMASDTEAEDGFSERGKNESRVEDEAAMMRMAKGRKASLEKKPPSPTAHLRTRAAKLVYKMQDDSRQAFEAEQSEFDRIEGLLKAVHQELQQSRQLTSDAQTEILDCTRRSLALVQQVYELA